MWLSLVSLTVLLFVCICSFLLIHLSSLSLPSELCVQASVWMLLLWSLSVDLSFGLIFCLLGMKSFPWKKEKHFSNCLYLTENDLEWNSNIRHVNRENAVFDCLSTATNSFGEQYITSLYWAAATSASVGYGDIHAYNTTEVRMTSFSTIHLCCGCCNTAVKRLRMFNVVMIRWPYDKFSGLRMFENFLQATYFTLLDSTNIPCTCFLSSNCPFHRS